jgi:hypothetical protein
VPRGDAPEQRCVRRALLSGSRNDGQLVLLPQTDQMGLSLLHRVRTDSSQDLNLHRIRNSLFSSPPRYAAPPITQRGGEVTDQGARSPVLTLCRPAVLLETSDGMPERRLSAKTRQGREHDDDLEGRERNVDT